MPMPEPTDFRPGAPLERQDAERQRRRTSAKAVGWNTLAGGTALGAGTLTNLKVAGTDVGQGALRAGAAKTKKTSPETSAQLKRVAGWGRWAKQNRNKTAAGALGLAGAAGLSRVAGQHKSNEEQGISQEIGRMRAGERYERTRSGIRKSAPVKSLLLATDYDLSNPTMRRMVAGADRNKRRIAAGTAAGAGGAAARRPVGAAQLVEQRPTDAAHGVPTERHPQRRVEAACRHRQRRHSRADQIVREHMTRQTGGDRAHLEMHQRHMGPTQLVHVHRSGRHIP